MIKKKLLAMVAGVSLFGSLVLDADAASVRVQCEQRGTSRSVISVDGRGLAAGAYTAQVISGSNDATSKNAVTAVRGEAEFDFDSNPKDIAAGATQISKTFIQGSVFAQIFDEDGFVVASASVACRVR